MGPLPLPVAPSAEADTDGRPVHLLIGADTYHPDVNGAAYFTYRLATGLAARGYDVHVVCPSTGGPASTRVEDGVTVHRLWSVRTLLHPTFRFCPPPLGGVATRRVLDTVAPDVVHVQGHFPIGRALVHAAHRRQLPLVATSHFMPDNLVAYFRVPPAVRRLACGIAWRDFARTFNHADEVTTPTPIAAELIRGKGLHRSLRAISCGIDLDRFPLRDPAGRTRDLFGLPDRPTLLFVGRLDEEKHVRELVAALPVIRGRVDAQLVLVGTGNQRARLVALADRLGVGEHVHCLGFVPDPDLPAAYAAADVFAMPGVAELQSLVTLEAMASGLPVIAADAMALPHLVHPGVNGHLYPPGDVAALAAHAIALLSAPLTSRRMGRASRDIAVGHDFDCTLSQFEDLYASMGVTASPASVLAGAAR